MSTISSYYHKSDYKPKCKNQNINLLEKNNVNLDTGLGKYFLNNIKSINYLKTKKIDKMDFIKIKKLLPVDTMKVNKEASHRLGENSCKT